MKTLWNMIFGSKSFKLHTFELYSALTNGEKSVNFFRAFDCLKMYEIRALALSTARQLSFARSETEPAVYRRSHFGVTVVVAELRRES